MRSFASERQLSVRLFVELRSQFDELENALGSRFHQNGDGVRIAQLGPGKERVLQVQFRRIAGTQGSGDAALGEKRIALEHTSFGQHRDTSVRCGFQRRCQACDAAADDDEIGHLGFNGAGPPTDGLEVFYDQIAHFGRRVAHLTHREALEVA